MHSMRYLFRRMLRSPGFTTMALAIIALAIGVNLGVFAFIQAILFHALGVPEPGRVVYYTLGNGVMKIPLSMPAYEALRSSADMKGIFAWKSTQFRVQAGTGVTNAYGAMVTGNTFTVLGLKPSLGRFFNEADDALGGGKDGWAAVLGYSYWRTHFGANPNVIGQNITVEGMPVHIVGVLPPEFKGILPAVSVGILLPRYFEAVSGPNGGDLTKTGTMAWYVFGRLPQGASIQSVQARLKAIEPSFRRLADPKGTIFTSALFLNTPPGSLLRVQDGRFGVSMIQLYAPLLVATEGPVGFMLLFCCCNLILLFAGRASQEAHAAAIRVALGARLGNEVRFAMLEATVLAAMGCLIATPIAWGVARILCLVIQSIPGFDGFPIIYPSAPIAITAMGLTLAIACLTGACTCLWQGRKRAIICLQEGRGTTATRSRNWIIGFEVFASILLITAVMVSGIGFQKLSSQPSGFGEGSAVVVSLDIKRDTSGIAVGPQKESASEKMDRILNRIESSPGVQSVAVMNMPPLSDGTAIDQVSTHSEGALSLQQQIWPANVSVKYFSAVGTRIVRGRDFTKDDLAGDPVCVLGNPAASALFSKENPLGKYLYKGGDAAKNEAPAPYCRVVGVAEDAHIKSMSDPPDTAVYLLTKGAMPNIVVKAATSGLAVQAVRNAVHTVDPAALDSSIETIQEHINDDLRVWRVITLSGVLCACIAAIILCIGFFGILSLQVAERKREIGIQIALGANRTQVCMSVMKKLRRAVLIGLVLGSGAALLAASSLAEIYHLSAGFVIGGYLGSLILLGILLLAAAFVPLRRALAVSPMECLNSE